MSNGRMYITFDYVHLFEDSEDKPYNAIIGFSQFSSFFLKNGTWEVSNTWTKGTITSVVSHGDVDTVSAYIEDTDNVYLGAFPLPSYQLNTTVRYGVDYQYYGRFQNITVSLDAPQNGGSLIPLVIIGTLGLVGLGYYLWKRK